MNVVFDSRQRAESPNAVLPADNIAQNSLNLAREKSI